MRQNIRKVLDAFAASKPAKGDSKATCWTDGDTIYSYALPIARRVPGRSGARERIEILAEYSTMTTNSQISAIRSRYPDAAIVDDEIPHPEQKHRDERIAR
jgi:hypothetical protein